MWISGGHIQTTGGLIGFFVKFLEFSACKTVWSVPPSRSRPRYLVFRLAAPYLRPALPARCGMVALGVGVPFCLRGHALRRRRERLRGRLLMLPFTMVVSLSFWFVECFHHGRRGVPANSISASTEMVRCPRTVNGGTDPCARPFLRSGVRPRGGGAECRASELVCWRFVEHSHTRVRGGHGSVCGFGVRDTLASQSQAGAGLSPAVFGGVWEEAVQSREQVLFPGICVSSRCQAW